MTKIAYILPSFYTCGGNRIAIEHCNGLAQRGHNVNIICLSKQFGTDWIEINHNIKIHYIEDMRKNNYFRDTNVVVCTYYETFYDMWGWKDLYPDAKLYYFIQQLEDRFFPDDGGKKRVKRTYELSKQNNVGIITEAKWLAKELKRLYGFDPIYVPNCQILPDSIPETEIKTKKIKVLVEGNAEAPGKGIQDAWEAIKKIDCYKILLTNSQRQNVPKQYKFDEMFCSVPWEKALSVIQAADILVKPSYFEGSPTPLMEAWELGILVVTTNCTGWDEYGIKDINCKVVKIGDIDAMRAEIEHLMLNNFQQKEYKKDNDVSRLVENGRVIAMNEFHGWKKTIDILENTFKK